MYVSKSFQTHILSSFYLFYIGISKGKHSGVMKNFTEDKYNKDAIEKSYFRNIFYTLVFSLRTYFIAITDIISWIELPIERVFG